MARKKISSKSSSKVKKKKWYKILAPKMFNEVVLGETNVVSPEDAIGKPVKTSLMNITNDIKKQNLSVSFIVEGLQGSNLTSSLVGYQMVPASIKRLVRRRRDRIDESFMCYTSDKKLIRVKPFLLTRSKTISSVLRDLRVKMIKEVVLIIQRTTYERLIFSMVNHRLQNEVKHTLNKIFPLKNFEIRQMALITKDTKGNIVEFKDDQQKAPTKDSVKSQPTTTKEPVKKDSPESKEPVVEKKVESPEVEKKVESSEVEKKVESSEAEKKVESSEAEKKGESSEVASVANSENTDKKKEITEAVASDDAQKEVLDASSRKTTRAPKPKTLSDDPK